MWPLARLCVESASSLGLAIDEEINKSPRLSAQSKRQGFRSYLIQISPSHLSHVLSNNIKQYSVVTGYGGVSPIKGPWHGDQSPI